MNYDFDENDIKVGKFLYFLYEKENVERFVGIVTKIEDKEPISSHGPEIYVKLPLQNKTISYSLSFLTYQVSQGLIVIK